MKTSSSFKIPKPLSWQAKLIAEIIAVNPRLVTAVIGRRAGKTHGALLIAITGPKGLLAGYDVAWLGPTDKVIAESKSWFKSWCGPLIVGASPGGLGYKLANGSVIDWWPAGPNAKQPVRSRGYGTVIVDECGFIAGLKLLIDSAVKPALAIDEGMLVLIGTPYGKTGADFYDLYREAQRSGVAYHAPSSVNPHLKATELERLRKTTDELTFRQEYGAEFLDKAGSLLRREQIKKGQPPLIESFKTIAFGLDIALSSKQRADYTALVVSGVDEQGRHWILHAVRWQSDWPTTFERVLRYNEAWQPHVIQTEQVAFQELAIREMIDAGLPITAIRPSTDKETRFAPVHLRYSLGQIWHAERLDSDFESEVLAFPQAKNDDQVDALVFGLTALDKKLRTAWTEENSGAHWAPLPHEKKPWVINNPDGSVMLAETSDPPGETVVATPGIHESVSPIKVVSEGTCYYKPAFTEKYIGDEFVVVGNDERELLRAHRSKFPIYNSLKAQGKLDWQQPGWVPPKEESE
jgi:predicted phage terminase large subunit-like protein